MATVWVSSTSAKVDAGTDHPGDHWQSVGFIDTAAQPDFYTHIQSYMGISRTTKGKPEFYLSGDPDNSWVRQVKTNPAAWGSFWILIKPFGSDQIHYDSGSIKYLLGADKATVVNGLTARPPESHPGRLFKPVTIAIKLRRSDGALFIPQYAP